MNLKNFKSRFVAAAFLLAGSWLTASGAQEWTYGKHTKNFTFSGGEGTQASPYLISNAQDLADLAYLVTQKNNDVTGWYFKQTADIVLNDFTYDGNGNITNTSSLKQWTPIGEYGYFQDDDFQGIYDGDGHTVSGVYIGSDARNREYVGLFGSCEDAIVKNLTVTDVYIELLTAASKEIGNPMVGSVVGRATSSTFANVNVRNSYINIKTHNWTYCGGFAGTVDDNGYLTDCSFTGNITVGLINPSRVGGLIGRVPSGELYLKRCFTGKGVLNVSPTSSNYHASYFGGLIGFYEKIPDGDYSQKKYGMEECTNKMDIVVAHTNTYKLKDIYAYAMSYEVPSIINCANFGSIEMGAGVWNSRMGFTNRFYRAMYCVSYGKYVLEGGSTPDRDVYIDILGKCSDHDEATFDEATLTDFADGKLSAAGSGVFVCPKECLPENVSEDWKKKYCSARNTQVSTEFLKAHAEGLAARVNKMSGKTLWGVVRMQGEAPFDIIGCPTTTAAGQLEFIGAGTEADPYLITSENDLRVMQAMVAENSSKWADKYYKLTADINMAGKASMGSIGTEDAPFTGTFDGDGHVISNLTESGPALFGYLGGTVRNLGIVGVTFVGGQYNCAGMAYTTGKKSAATISNCYIGGTIAMNNPTGYGGRVQLAGMVSTIDGTTDINNCYFKGTLSINETSAVPLYYGFVSDESKYTNRLTCSDCYASFSRVLPSKCDTYSVTGFTPESSQAKISNCFYVCSTVQNPSLGKGLDSDAELGEYFNDKDGWFNGPWRPVLWAVRHYMVDGQHGYYAVDAIPIGGNDNTVYSLSLSESENSSYADDPLLWALPNMAVYNPADDTEYIINCHLLPGSDFVYKKLSGSKKVKGEMHYPLTISQNGYSALCLPGIVRKESLPEDSKLYICGEVKTVDGQNSANIVECDTVPAGVPFIVKVPTEIVTSDGKTTSLVGQTVDIVMRGEIVDSPTSTLPTGAQTGMLGLFKGDYVYALCTKIEEKDGELVASAEEGRNATPFSGYFKYESDVRLVDYILLDETSNDIQDIISDNKGKIVNIKLKRALQNGWNTICLPFAMSDEEIRETFGEGTLVEQLTGVGNSDGVCTLTFSKTTGGIEAGKAYLIKPASGAPATVLSFRSKQMADGDKEETEEFSVTGASGTLCFQGNYARKALISDGTTDGLYFTQNNKIYRVASGSSVIMNGFHCFIRTSEPNALSAARMVHNDGSTTDLRLVEVGSTADGQRVYNLQGMQADEKAGRGVYIKNGRKFVRK